jgi:DNA repair exonuclease SbcCD nuclease subunit
MEEDAYIRAVRAAAQPPRPLARPAAGSTAADPGDWCFVHAADLHLDTPFEGIRADAPHVADALADASLGAFDAVVALALDRRAKFVVLAGDIYDGAERGIRAQLHFRRRLEDLTESGISVFVVHGNHDPVESGWSAIRSWPTGVVIFPAGVAEVAEVIEGGDRIATVQGISYPRRDVSENLALRFERPSGGGPHVGVLHCNVAGTAGHADYSPCRLDDLRRVGLDYWALGHIHQRSVLAGGSGGPFVVYSGNTQGRSLKSSERGEKGATVVHVRDGAITEAEFVACDVIRFEQVDVDVARIGDIPGLAEELTRRGAGELAQAGGRSVVLRARLVGRGPVHEDLRRGGGVRALVSDLRSGCSDAAPFAWWDALEDATRPRAEHAAIRARGDFASDLLALSDSVGADAGELADLFTRCSTETMPAGLRELAAKLVEPDRVRAAVLEGALARALDLLEGEPA